MKISYRKYIVHLGILLVLQSCMQEYKMVEQTSESTNTTPPTIHRTPQIKVEDKRIALEQRIAQAEQSMLSAGLINVQSLDSTIHVELKYSTTDNFVGVDVYGDIVHAYLQQKPAEKLANAQQHLKALHPFYTLLIYDGARPRQVQQVLWDTLDKPLKLKPLYVADPKIGSIHNYGAAVDLTVADSTGKPLDMGTPYDFFGELAYPSKEAEMLRQGKLNEEQVKNRKLLREVMQQAGFMPIESEWWHFNALSLKRCKEEYSIVE